MHQSVLLLAQYNQVVNAKLLELLKPLPLEQLSSDQGVYFKSLIGLLNHILNSDQQWIAGLSTHLPETEAVMEQIPRFEIADFMAIPFPTLEEFCPPRIAMDHGLVEFVKAISPQRMNEHFEHADPRGGDAHLSVRFSATPSP